MIHFIKNYCCWKKIQINFIQIFIKIIEITPWQIVEIFECMIFIFKRVEFTQIFVIMPIIFILPSFLFLYQKSFIIACIKYFFALLWFLRNGHLSWSAVYYVVKIFQIPLWIYMWNEIVQPNIHWDKSISQIFSFYTYLDFISQARPKYKNILNGSG